MNLYTSGQNERYFQAKLTTQGHGKERMARCPFHDDRKASLRVNFETGSWYCHACCVGGGPVEFEMRLENASRLQARKQVNGLVGITDYDYSQEPEAIYDYRDETDRILYRKIRQWGKRFSFQRVDENGKWVDGLSDVRRVLYNLPRLLVSNHVLVVEGEKDADRIESLALDQLDPAGFSRVCATTQDSGAGSWRREFNPYFTGKQVAILPDFDRPGIEHAQMVAENVAPYARNVKIVELPGLPEHGDVSDFLDRATPDELIKEIKAAPLWKRTGSKVLVPAPEFDSLTQEEIEWLVAGVIQKGANGFFCAMPKVGKSWLAEDLAVSLALGVPWLDFQIQGRHRVALISREDNPGLTRWRIRSLTAGKGHSVNDLGDGLYINTREQTSHFMVDNPAEVPQMVAALKEARPEIAIFDVFNVLHQAEENDNTEMRKVLQSMSDIQSEVGCAIGVAHHFNKLSEGSMTQRLRGSSAIAGWAEWLIGIDNPNGDTRRVQFELKAAAHPEPRYFVIESANGISHIRVCDPPVATVGNRARQALQ